MRWSIIAGLTVGISLAILLARNPLNRRHSSHVAEILNSLRAGADLPPHRRIG
jgi:hypothetical protein